MANEVLHLYAIRNHEGKWFRAKGFSGSGPSWVDELAKAKIYPKLSQARSRVTFFANNSHGLPTPVLVELEVTKRRDIDETERIEKSRRLKEKQQAEAAERQAKHELEVAQRTLREAQEKIARLGGGG